MSDSIIRHRVESEVFPARDGALARGFATHNYAIEAHDHSFCEINIVLEGSGVHYIEDKSLRARRGDVFVIPPSVSHGYASGGEDFNVFHLILKDGFFAKYGGDLRALPGYRLLFEIEPYLRLRSQMLFLDLSPAELFSISDSLKLLNELEGDSTPGGDTLRNLHALFVITELSSIMHNRVSAPDTAERREYSAIAASIDYIHSSPFERITIDALAALSNMSRSSFIRKFKAIFSKSPMQYIIEQKVISAERMIGEGEAKTQVAHRCGFYDLSHMEKAIAKYRKKELS